MLAGFLAGGGRLNVPAALAAAAAWLLTTGSWWLAARWGAASGRAPAHARALGAAPLLPWLVAWPLLILAALHPLARTQLLEARLTVGSYLLGWLLAGLGALALWVQVIGAKPASPASRITLHASRAWWLAAPLLALATVSYWNGAVLDPLQFRGFPDYVTQMGGARRLLAGQLPYDPDVRVWTDVNLPPITLLLLFAPFTVLSELGGKLAYFLVNHLAFLAGLALLLTAARPPATVMRPVLWTSLVAAMALTFEPWHDSLRLGQQNGIVFCFLVLSLAALLRRRDTLAGIALTAALIGKPSSALLGLYFLYARRWRAALACAASGLLVFLLTLPWAGRENWCFYLLEKAPEILAGTPQQSNVALLALHARLFLPADALSSFDAMPALPAAQALTRVAQLLGALALWRLTRSGSDHPVRQDSVAVHLEFGIALVLSLSLVGHAWQSYVTWLIVAFVLLADPRVWTGVPAGVRPWVVGIAAGSYAAVALHDVALYKVIGTNSLAATVFASLPNVALLVLAFALALLRSAYHAPGCARAGAVA